MFRAWLGVAVFGLVWGATSGRWGMVAAVVLIVALEAIAWLLTRYNHRRWETLASKFEALAESLGRKHRV